MGRMKEMLIEMEEEINCGYNELDAESVAILNMACRRLFEVSELLKYKKETFDATNLPVSEAVSHVQKSISNDIEYLTRLAAILRESAPVLRKVSGDDN